MLSQSPDTPGLRAFHFEAFFTGEAAEPAQRPISLCNTPAHQNKAIAEEIAAQAWFVRIRISEVTPAFIDYETQAFPSRHFRPSSKSGTWPKFGTPRPDISKQLG